MLLTAGVITEEDYELLGSQGCDGKVDAEKAARIADAITQKLESMKPTERILADQSISSEPKKLAVFNQDTHVDANELYSASFEWLNAFVSFCRRSRGFEVR